MERVVVTRPAALSAIDAAKYCGVERGYFDKVIVPTLTVGTEIVHNPNEYEAGKRKKASYLIAGLDSYLAMRREQAQNRVLIPRKLKRVG